MFSFEPASPVPEIDLLLAQLAEAIDKRHKATGTKTIVLVATDDGGMYKAFNGVRGPDDYPIRELVAKVGLLI